MRKTPQFPDLLRMIDERSRAFRAAIAATPWPHGSATADCHDTEGRSRHPHPGADGARAERLTSAAPDVRRAHARRRLLAMSSSPSGS
ncbi:hypothetical protein [Streptomyces sp. CBMA123]|uniref:hypothetical protein n=1 Tax=Streptomyces sp. CBMA123 TaxID=1896313 RepID=UPI001661F60C|nr:hypothetical protein [Streptomyces sp. CBMA123]MBD0690110.1 hypothetical protein [Streptomyces sp. CBMA123]